MFKTLKKFYKENPYKFAISLGCFVYIFLVLISYIFDRKELNEIGKTSFIVIVLSITLFEDFKASINFWK